MWKEKIPLGLVFYVATFFKSLRSLSLLPLMITWNANEWKT